MIWLKRSRRRHLKKHQIEPQIEPLQKSIILNLKHLSIQEFNIDENIIQPIIDKLSMTMKLYYYK